MSVLIFSIIYNLIKIDLVRLQICIHPEVSAYISEMLTSLKPVMEGNEVEYIAFVVTQPNKSDAPLERFIFDVSLPKNTSIK